MNSRQLVRMRWFLSAAMALVFCLSIGARAQDTTVQVRGTDVRSLPTPTYNITGRTVRGNKDWTRIEVEYETKAKGGWIDELTFDWNVALIPGNGKPIVMKRLVSYLDVADGRHYEAMFLRPGFLERYYGSTRLGRDAVKVYLEVRAAGEVLLRYHYPQEKVPVQWWGLEEPRVQRKDAELLTRMQTPFMPLEFDRYEYIKPE